MIKNAKIKFDQVTLNCFYKQLIFSENKNKNYKNDIYIFIKNGNTRKFSYYVIFYLFNDFKRPNYKIHSKNFFFQNKVHLQNHIFFGNGFSTYNKLFSAKKTVINKKLYKCFILIKKDLPTILNPIPKICLDLKSNEKFFPINEPFFKKTNLLKQSKNNNVLNFSLLKNNKLFFLKKNSPQKNKKKLGMISTFIKQKNSIFYSQLRLSKNQGKFFSFIDFLLLQVQLLINQLKKTNNFLNFLQLELLYSKSLCLNFTFLYQILFGNNSFAFRRFKTLPFCSTNNNILTISKKNDQILILDNNNFNNKLLLFIKKQISLKSKFYFFEQLKSEINTSHNFVILIKHNILSPNCNYNFQCFKNSEKYVSFFSNFNINSINFLKKKFLTNNEDKKKKILNSFVFQKIDYFCNKKVIFYYLLIKILEGSHKQSIKKQKIYLQIKQKVYLTKKRNLFIPDEFHSNLVIKRENYGFSLLSKSILIFFEKISFLSQFLNYFNLVLEKEFVKLNLFQMGFSHSLFLNKKTNINFEGLNIKYSKKNFPEYFKSINYRKKTNILFSHFFSQTIICSQLALFQFLSANYYNFKNFESKKNNSKQLKKIFFSSNEIIHEQVGSLYNFFLFSNRVNRQKLKYTKFFLNLSFRLTDSYLNQELFLISFFIFIHFILICSLSYNLKRLSFYYNWRSFLLIYNHFNKHLQKKHDKYDFNLFKVNCLEKYQKYLLDINSIIEVFSFCIFTEKNTFKIPLIKVFPSAANVRLHLSKIKIIIKKANNKTQENLIHTLSKEIKMWSSLYNFMNTKKIFKYCDYITFKYLWRWACRRHPNKSKHWIKKKYFKFERNKNWVFSTLEKRTQSLLILENHQ